MKIFRGYILPRKLVRFFGSTIRRRFNPGPLQFRTEKWGRGMIRFGHDNKVETPKGMLPVYVGGESGIDRKRILMPVIYINHPLFEDLLKEAERVYGFGQAGVITLPCRVSEYEKVVMRIEAWDQLRRGKVRRC